MFDNRRGTGKDEWLTPPHILEQLGPFDLDPCAAINRPWPTAKNHFTIEDNGLSKIWFGRVWCNPPYGHSTNIWLKRCADYGNVIVLTFARTDTKMFFNHVWKKADAVLFIQGRLHFYHTTGEKSKLNSGAPNVLIAYGKNNIIDLDLCNIPGKLIIL